MRIKITCKGADELSIDSLKSFQGKLKKITNVNLEKLKRRIIEDGINVPLFVWKNNNSYSILDGHQRLKALFSLRDDGYELPLIPVAYIEAENERDAKKKLLGITSQYGEFEIEELSEWMKDIDDDIADTFRFVENEILRINKKDIEDVKEKIKSKEIKEYKKVHILLSMNQDIFFGIKDKLFEIKKIDGIEYEQSQN
jgi:hypothetical protein